MQLTSAVFQSLRTLVRRPGTSIAIVVTLALGIGANLAVLAMARTLLAAAPTLRDAPAIALLQPQLVRTGAEPVPIGRWSYPLYDAFRHAYGADDVAAYMPQPVHVNLSTSEALRVKVEAVSGNYFDFTGASLADGRAFIAEEDDTAAPRRVVVLGASLAQRVFGSIAAARGQHVVLNDESFTVVGIAEAGFAGLSEQAEAWVPMADAPALTFANRLRSPTSFWHAVVVRDPLTARIDAAIATAAASLPLESILGGGRIAVASTTWLEARRDPALERSARVLSFAVALLLALAIGNVAQVVLAQVVARTGELGVRQALGAGAGAIATRLAAECLWLSAFGGAFGWLLAWSAWRMLPALLPGAISERIAAGSFAATGTGVAAVALALGAGLAIAAAAAWLGMRCARSASLRSRDDGPSALSRWRGIAIAGQSALAVFLLAAAGLAVISAARTAATPLGFSPDRVLAASVSLPASQGANGGLERTYDRVLSSAAAIPGASRVALANCLPLGNSCDRTLMDIRGRVVAAGEPGAEVAMNMVSSDYFGMLAIPLVSGRTLAESDRAHAPRVAVISAEAARRYWPAGDALGARIQLGVGWGEEDDFAEVVGIVGDVPLAHAGESPAPMVYLSWRQYAYGENSILVESTQPAALAVALRAAIRKAAPELPPWNVRTLRDQARSVDAIARSLAALLGTLAALGCVLAAIGVHGIASFFVARRSREFGVRLALGAAPRRIAGTVFRASAVPVAFGVVIGLGTIALLAPLAMTLLPNVAARDPFVYLAAAAIVLAAAAAGSALPATRAAHSNPLLVLRAE